MNTPTPLDPFDTLLAHCERDNIRLTPLRKEILAIVNTSDKPLTAYSILDVLKATHPNAQVMSVYRVLNFLLEHELIHRIESLNAFMRCYHIDEHEHYSQWLICKQCGNASEHDLPAFQNGLSAISQETGFKITNPVIELTGICQDCQNNRETTRHA